MAGYVNKVYINPNFNKTNTSQITRLQSSSMHVNPKFSQNVNTCMQRIINDSVKSKIYINPNFIRPGEFNQFATTSSAADITSSVVAPAVVSIIQPTISKTRYTLVRREQKVNENINIKEKPKHTVTISKYKSITVKDLKKSLEAASVTSQNKTDFFYDCKKKYKLNQQSARAAPILNKSKEVYLKKCPNKYKFIKNCLKDDLTNKRILLSNTNKLNILPRSKYRSSKVIGKLKKNNIPCPLFRKYGKCLRRERSTCDFLHDKKHVSLCRKFIKGLCFDKDCLLSHDVSSNKMPTCSFYLKGICSKEDCPYLHVKVNENATICSDFIKGYCEKGSSCSKRHDNICLEEKLTQGKSNPYPLKDKKTTLSEMKFKKIIKKYNTSNNETIKGIKQRTVSRIKLQEHVENNVKEVRYYKETLDVSDICEIKPSRCKIGSLPSFIQL